jgi:hypothetical protein
MTPQEKTAIRDKRVRAAFNVETPDRVPIFMSGQGFFKFVDPKATLADYFRRPEYVDDLLIEAAKLPDLAEIDQPPVCGTISEAGQEAFAAMMFARIRLPGRELPENTLWNVDESGPMTEDDYDTIINKGWEYMTEELNKRIGFDPAKVQPPKKEYMDKVQAKVRELGKISIISAWTPFAPFECVSGARKLNNWIRDLRRFPDKVRAALDIVEDAAVKQTIKQVKATPNAEYGFVGGSRCGSSFISPATFERFYFPFFRKLIPAMMEAGLKTWLHMDNDWAGFLHYFREFPKGSCIWDPDQMTGMMKIKEAVGDKMCITGDVPPALLSVGTPDACYEYTKKLCADMGKTGFIMAPGCSVPMDAKRANVAAVVAATMDS